MMFFVISTITIICGILLVIDLYYDYDDKKMKKSRRPQESSRGLIKVPPYWLNFSSSSLRYEEEDLAQKTTWSKHIAICGEICNVYTF